MGVRPGSASTSERGWPVLRAPHGRSQLDDGDVLGARALGALAGLEGHLLPFAQAVEMRARGLVEEVFAAVFRRDETETLVADETLDRAVDCCHVSDTWMRCSSAAHRL